MRVALALLLLLPATASWAVPFEGSWATDRERCAKPDAGNIRIIGGSYFSHETDCVIRNAARRPIGYTLSLECKGKGEPARKKVVLRSIEGGAKLVVNGTALVRCQAGLQPPNYPTVDRASP